MCLCVCVCVLCVLMYSSKCVAIMLRDSFHLGSTLKYDYGACFAEERFFDCDKPQHQMLRIRVVCGSWLSRDTSQSVVVVRLACSVALPRTRRKGGDGSVANCVQDVV